MKYSAIVILFLAFIATGCKRKTLPQGEKIVAVSKKKVKRQVLAALTKNNFDFDWYEFKGKIDADLPTMYGAGTVYIRMEKGEKIWFSAKKFGFEGGRGLITPEKASVINRLERTYMEEDPNDFLGLLPYPLKFEELQKLISGQIIDLTDKKSIVKIGDTEASVIADVEGNTMEYIVDLATMNVKKVIATGDETLEVTYSNYKEMGDYGTHPGKIEVNFTQKGKKGHITLITNKLTLDVEKKMPFSVSSKYKRVRF